MKLGELRSAIRKTKGNPIVKVPLVGGTIFTLSLQKKPLLEELERAYPGGKATETYLDFVEETGLLRGTGGPPAVTEAPEEVDLSADDEIKLAAIRAQLGEADEDLLEETESDDDDLLV